MTEKENLERCGDIDVLIKDLERRIEKTEQEIAELWQRRNKVIQAGRNTGYND